MLSIMYPYLQVLSDIVKEADKTITITVTISSYYVIQSRKQARAKRRRKNTKPYFYITGEEEKNYVI